MIEVVTHDIHDVQNALQNMSGSEIDKLTFGAIQLDDSGKILFYNAKESEITGRNAKDVIGKNFFKEVAPCTQGRLFEDKFYTDVVLNKKSVLFEYVFDYNMTPTKVKVHMKPSLRGNTYWILVAKY